MDDLDLSEDRRLFLRIASNIRLKYACIDSHKLYSAQASDISANGIGLTVDKKFPCQTPLKLIIDLPDDGPFQAEGEVAWVKKTRFHEYRVGIMLKKIDLMGVSRVLSYQKKIQLPSTPELHILQPFSLIRWFKSLFAVS